ncbi:MAG: hypothetical protein E6H99_11070 [Chloroflexi bacterium]|nr:MAG: hypothetical protein E6H99_11070 [Chloroflexota bacterium]
MIVNVCPAAVTPASPERIWTVLTTPERFGEWMGASFVAALVVHFPFGIDNHERVTLTETKEGGTLVRFN